MGSQSIGHDREIRKQQRATLTGAKVFEIPSPKSLEKSEETGACRVKRQPGSPQTTSNPTTWPWRTSCDCPCRPCTWSRTVLGRRGAAREEPPEQASGPKFPRAVTGPNAQVPAAGPSRPLRAGGDWGPSGAPDPAYPQTPAVTPRCRIKP